MWLDDAQIDAHNQQALESLDTLEPPEGYYEPSEEPDGREEANQGDDAAS